MKHLVGKPISMSITPEGLLYTIVADEHTVEIINTVNLNSFEMCIVPTDTPDVLEMEPVEFDTLVEALNFADELIDEWAELEAQS